MLVTFQKAAVSIDTSGSSSVKVCRPITKPPPYKMSGYRPTIYIHVFRAAEPLCFSKAPAPAPACRLRLRENCQAPKAPAPAPQPWFCLSIL